MSGPDVPHLLPATVRPTHYALRIAVDLQRLAFAGDVSIDLAVVTATRTIVLHALDLAVGAAFLDGTPLRVHTVDARAQQQTVTFHLDDDLAPHSTHVLRIV